MPETFACPKCNRTLRRNGQVDVEGQAAPLDVFQCDECLVPWNVDGQQFDTALTFAVDRHGQVLDPERLEPLDLSN